MSKPNFAMKNNTQEMLATIVKERRKKLNYTQQELSDISNISLRSIQRIEKGEVSPRLFTIKTLAKCLDFPLDFLNEAHVEAKPNQRESIIKKAISSVFLVLITFLIATAFIAQAPKFPETHFEVLTYYTVISILLFLALFKLWKHKNAS